MSSELKPCPACGIAVKVCEYSDRYNPYLAGVECEGCGLTRSGFGTGHLASYGEPGPTEADKQKAKQAAIAAWNAMPRELEWSSEPPKVPGRYWCRHRERGATQWGEPYVPAVNIFDKYNLEVDNDVQWAGPIPEPKGGAE